ncbi:unnamed protein product [Somion occarium]|uniref:HNH nuclease domain-containing protein n=1 Tax=Somion occarium TaxID=3059160 RepID=A0ABP1DYK7_9APHY
MQVHETGTVVDNNRTNEARQEETQGQGQGQGQGEHQRQMEVSDDDAYRNVFLVDYTGNVIAGFWQYGFTTWLHFLKMVQTVMVTNNQDWAVFRHRSSASIGEPIGERQKGTTDLVQPGSYIILSPDKTKLEVSLTTERCRTRHTTLSNTPSRDSYCERTLVRDGMCLLSGQKGYGRHTRLDAAHIFPRGHDVDWYSKGFQSLITDKAPLSEIGGPSKIDSLQNLISLKADLHKAWDNYEVGVNPDDGHIIFPFLRGYLYRKMY